jgi:hypothetical protein
MKKLFVFTFLLLGITSYSYGESDLASKQPVVSTGQNDEISVEKVLSDLYFCVKASEHKVVAKNGSDPEIEDGFFAGLDCEKTIDDIQALEISEEEIEATVKRAIKEVAIEQFIQCKKENYLSDKNTCETQLEKAQSYGATDEEIKETAGDLASLLNL